MKRNESKKQEQTNQVEQKDKERIVRVRSGLRAGQSTIMIPGCCDNEI